MIRHLLGWLSRDDGDDTHVGAAWLKRREVLEMRETWHGPRWHTPAEIEILREASKLEAQR